MTSYLSEVSLQLGSFPCFLDDMRNAVSKNNLPTRQVLGHESKLSSTIGARAELPN